MTKVSVIIPTMLGREELLRKLLSTVPPEYETIVVDDKDLLLAAKRNKGARQATGEYLLFIDDDNYLESGAIHWMLEKFGKEIGVMGMVACYQDKKMLVADGGSMRSFVTGFTRGRYTNTQIRKMPEAVYDVDEVANAFMVRREVFQDAGGFDEENFPIDLDEADLCKRIKDMGYRIVMNPKAICYHRSITYSPVPDFRRASNAYFLPRNKLNHQRKHLNAISYWMHVIVFLPVHFCIYTTALLWRKKFSLIPPYIRGTWDGLRGRRENKYQPR